MEMVKPLDPAQIGEHYRIDQEGYIKLSMNTFLVDKEDRKILFDPGTADFLPIKLQREYGLEIPIALEKTLADVGVLPEQITDVVFTHLHFDHASGAFKRIPGNIVKRFPLARYHLLKEHYQYAMDPDPFEADSFCTGLLKYVEKLHWLEEWDQDWISFRIFNGHTRGMVVPVIQAGDEKICFASDLLPMDVFLDPGTWCGYDLEPGLQLSEKRQFLQELEQGTKIVLFHDTLKKSVIYR